ncbi:hypothetical protein B0T11DRAFT_293784 [Plectosphaerella cucumerina]|uniref:CCHC-type domain-containing protein n=1 Tax=Plectosphaerella cucumerina TaxID=40658 RepID=A0A8K0TPV0_9PEZI|nr:hypothetical protein B0T11DRAFT_293784 [Plectosphaerella cucumerina]
MAGSQGSALPGAPAESASKKRPLEDDDAGTSSVEQASVPGKKRRRTSGSRQSSSSASGKSSRSKKARVAQEVEVSADDEAYEPSLDSLESGSGIASQSESQARDTTALSNGDGPGVTRRITRSLSQSAASNTTMTNTPSASDASGKKAKKKTKKQKLDDAALAAKNSDIPNDPYILNAPAGDDFDWKLRFTAFRKELQKKAPQDTITPESLVKAAQRYLKKIAWRRQPNRQQQVQDAKKALFKLQLTGELGSVIADDEPEKEAGAGDEDKQQTAAGQDDQTPKKPKSANAAWVYPDDPLLLDPDYPGESFEDSLRRLCQVIVDGDAVGSSRFTANWLEKMVMRWVVRKAWANAGAARAKKVQAATKSIQGLAPSGKLKEIFQAVLGTKAGTAEDDAAPSDSDGASNAEELPETEAVQEPETDAEASALPPSASDWAALLGTDTASAEAPGDTEVLDTPVKPPAPGRTVMSEQESAEEKLRYFPGLADSDTLCVACAATDHTAQSCPRALCRHCQGEHFAWACPERRRCKKCKQLGHAAAVCKEKLAMTADEGLECAFCGASNHLEDECDAVGRSWVSTPETRRKVRYIPAFCSACGIEGHYSSECTLRGDWGYSATWSLANRDQFVDPASEFESISAMSEAAAAPARMGHQIKGAASRNTHIFFDDTDGSEEGEFIGKKVAPKVSTGPIRMATNIQFAPLQGQPPLPPGPPPTGPAPKAGGYSRLAQAPRGPAALPPRPPTGPMQMTRGPQLNLQQPPPSAPSGPSNPGNGRQRNRKASGGGGPPQKQLGKPRRKRGGKQ